MDTRYAANPKDFKHYTTEEMRSEFLIEELFIKVLDDGLLALQVVDIADVVAY